MAENCIRLKVVANLQNQSEELPKRQDRGKLGEQQRRVLTQVKYEQVWLLCVFFQQFRDKINL